MNFAVPLSASATAPAADVANVQYAWTITDPSGAQSTLTGANPSFIPQKAGAYGANLLVTDGTGGMATASGTFTILSSPVAIHGFALPSGAVEGATVGLHGSADDALGGAVTLTWTITPPKGAALTATGTDVSFVPPANGGYQVTLTANSVNGSATVAGTFSVANLPPSVTSVTLPKTPVANTPLTLVATATDPGGDADTLTYQWTLLPPIGLPIVVSGAQATFTPAYEGDYNIRLVVTDGDGAQAFADAVLPVLDAPLTAGALTLPVAVEGQPFQNVPVFHFTDADPSGVAIDYTAVVTLGDGNQLTLTGNPGSQGQIVASKGGFDVQLSYTYAQVMSGKTFGVTVTDAGGATASASTNSFAVADAPLVAGALVANGGVEYTNVTTLAASFTFGDQSAPASRFSGTINWGDGTSTEFTSAAITGAGGSYAVSGKHQYALYGSYPITVTINDTGGSSTIDRGTTIVADALMTKGSVSASGGIEYTTPTSLSATLTDADPSVLSSRFSGTISWGDGTSTAFTSQSVTGSGGTYTVSGTHQYALYGSYSITVTINDAGGSSTSDGGTTSVADAPLTKGGLSAAGGIAYTTATALSAIFTDADLNAAASRFSGTINWGDGTSTLFTSAAVTGSGGTYTISGSHQYALAGNYPITVTVNDAGGSAATDTGSTMVAKASTSATVMTTSPVYTGSPVNPIASVHAMGAGGLNDSSVGGFAFSYSGTSNAGLAYGPSATAPTNAGSYTVTVTYNGDPNHSTSSSSAVPFSITKASSSATVMTTNPVYTGSQLNPIASVLATGAGSLSDSKPSDFTFTYAGSGSTVYAASATPPTNAGNYTVTATYNGDANHSPSSASTPVPFSIGKASSAASILSISNPTYTGLAAVGIVTSVQATGAGSLSDTSASDFTFSYAGSGSTVYAASVTPPTNAGNYTVTASYTGDANHNPSSASTPVPFSIGKASSMTTLTTNTNLVYTGATVAPVATVRATGVGALTDTNTADFTFSYSGTSTAGVAYGPSPTAPTNAGSYSVTATYNGDANHSTSSSGAVPFVISAAATNVILTSSRPSGSYYGQSMTITAAVSIVAPGGGTPVGAVQFAVNGVNIGSPVAIVAAGNGGYTAQLTSSTLPIGSDALKATFTPSSSNFMGGYNVLTQTVGVGALLLDSSGSAR